MKIARFAKDWDWKAVSKPEVIEIGELQLSVPAFRKRSRLVAYCQDNRVHFGLQYQHEGEPEAWLPDPSFPWHGANLSSLVIAAAQHHERIEKVLKGGK